MPEIRLEKIKYSYSPGTAIEHVALEDVNLTFRSGRVTGVIGHTGSGKSTMMQLLNGLLKPTAGKVFLDGKDIWEKPKEIRSLRFRVGLVMQYPEYQLFDETVHRDIEFGPRNMGLAEEEIQKRVNASAAFVGLNPNLFEVSPFDLSGGQKRRAAIAGVMAMCPEVLVLDEPAAGLDPRGREAIFSGIEEYRRAQNATVIIVSHSMEDIAKYCDDVVVMANGKVFASGTRNEIFSRSDELLSLGLDIPQIGRIALALRRNGVEIPAVYTVEEAVKAISALYRRGGER